MTTRPLPLDPGLLSPDLLWVIPSALALWGLVELSLWPWRVLARRLERRRDALLSRMREG